MVPSRALVGAPSPQLTQYFGGFTSSKDGRVRASHWQGHFGIGAEKNSVRPEQTLRCSEPVVRFAPRRRSREFSLFDIVCVFASSNVLPATRRPPPLSVILARPRRSI